MDCSMSELWRQKANYKVAAAMIMPDVGDRRILLRNALPSKAPMS
jgi:hypothetical protein